MLWGIGLLGLAHLLSNGDVAGLILFGGLALFGFAWQPLTDRRDAAVDPRGVCRDRAYHELLAVREVACPQRSGDAAAPDHRRRRLRACWSCCTPGCSVCPWWSGRRRSSLATCARRAAARRPGHIIVHALPWLTGAEPGGSLFGCALAHQIYTQSVRSCRHVFSAKGGSRDRALDSPGDRRSRRDGHAQPAGPSERLRRGDARAARPGARSDRARPGDPRRAADRRRAGVLRRPGPRRAADRGRRRGRSRRHPRSPVQPADPPPPAPRAAGAVRGQRRRRRRRRQSRAGLRHRAGRPLRELHPGVLQARPGAGFRRHVHPAAPGRPGARDGPRHARRAAAGRAGRGLGPDLALRRRRPR